MTIKNGELPQNYKLYVFNHSIKTTLHQRMWIEKKKLLRKKGYKGQTMCNINIRNFQIYVPQKHFLKSKRISTSVTEV